MSVCASIDPTLLQECAVRSTTLTLSVVGFPVCVQHAKYAILVPSGDHAGPHPSFEPELGSTGRALPPSAFITQSCPPWNQAILEPSGDHAGSMSCCGSVAGSCVSRCGWPPPTGIV